MRTCSQLILVVWFAAVGATTPALGAPAITVDVPLARALAVAFSPDGRQVAIGGLDEARDAPADGIVVLVDAATGDQQALLRHSGTIKSRNGSSSSINMIKDLAYSPDGKLLAVAAELGLKLCDPARGVDVATLAGYGDRESLGSGFSSIAFSPDGTLLAAANARRGQMILWDVATRQPGRDLEMMGSGDVAFAKDGTLIVTAGYMNAVHLWRVADGTQVAEVNAKMGPLYGVAIDPAGKLVVAVGEGGEKMWRLEPAGDGRWRFVDEAPLAGYGPVSPVRGVAFSPDGRLLVTYSDSGVTMVYDATTREPVGVLWAGGPSAFSPDGKRLAVAETVRGSREAVSRFSIWTVDDVLNPDRLAEQARQAASELVRIVASGRPDYDAQPRALGVLGGPHAAAATPTLVAALANRQIQKKQLIVMALGRVAAANPDAVAALATALREDPAADTRTAAAMALTMLPREAAASALPALAEAGASDESPDVQRAALRALERLDKTAFQEALTARRARGPIQPKVVKRDGLIIYQGRPLEEWIERLGTTFVPNEIFGRPSPSEPQAAIRAIGADAVPVLIDSLQSPRWELRRAAAAGLETLGSVAAPATGPLLEALAAAKPEDMNAAGAAADALAGILKGEKEWPARLLELADSDNPTVRLVAARAVAQLDPAHPRGVATLKAAFAATSTMQMNRPMPMASFPEQPSVRWLAKTVVDDEAPVMYRINAAATLARMKADALPALPELIKALGDPDENVSQHAAQAIQQIGPQAVPAVSEALKSATDASARKRLAMTLWPLGDEGRRAVTDLLQGQDAEELWWAAALGAGNPHAARHFQMAVREALEKCGPRQPFHPEQPYRQPNFPRYEPPTRQWSAKVLADGDAPRHLRIQLATSLLSGRGEEFLPLLPAFLEAIQKEPDRTLQSQLANVIQRMGPQAIPAVEGAIEAAKSGGARRELLRALSQLGDEGQREFARLMQITPEYRELFSQNPRSSKDNEKPGRERRLSALERRALANAERTGRPLTNGNFAQGFDDWHLEGGAKSFNLFARGDGKVLSTFGGRKDADAGRVFQCFKVPGDASALAFKLHGGANREKTWVALWRKNYRHGQMAARNDNTPFQAYFDLTLLRGEVVTLEIVDSSSDGWGFIGAEDFRLVTEKELRGRGAAPQKFHFDVELLGRQGQVIKGGVDAANDALVITFWSGPAEKTWTPLVSELPLTLYAYAADGQRYDVPEKWNGKISGWAFLLPPDRDLTSVAWKEGAVDDFWKGASFGWGGLRNSLGKVVTGRPGSDETQRFRYIPMEGNSASDISFKSVKVKPAK